VIAAKQISYSEDMAISEQTTSSAIELRGVRVNNLKGVDVSIPLGKLTVVVGLSGAGKSSLVFETLYAESQRRYLQSFSTASRQLLERFDQPDADWIGDLPPAIAVRAGDAWGAHRWTVADVTPIGEAVAELFSSEGTVYCLQCGRNVAPQSPAAVVADLQSRPAGTRLTIGFPDGPSDGDTVAQWLERLREEGWTRVRIAGDLRRIDESAQLEKVEDALVVVDRVEIGKVTDERLLETMESAYRRGGGRAVAFDDHGEFRFDERWRCPDCRVDVAVPEPRLFDARDPLGACESCGGRGVIKGATCSECGGTRFNARALSVQWRGRTIAEVLKLPLRELRAVASDAGPPHPRPLSREGRGEQAGLLISAIAMLVDLGLTEISAGQSLESLSGGEAQRLKIHRVLAAELADALYLFDEPTASLHPGDVARLIPAFVALRDAGNTVVAIDHHPLLWKVADHIIELGPGAGDDGGQIVYQGPFRGLAKCEASNTARWLDNDEISPSRTKSSGILKVATDAADISIPLGVVCVIAGVSGVGKTRLLRDQIVPAVERGKTRTMPVAVTIAGLDQIGDVAFFDQSPLSRSKRSNPATVMKIFDDVRELFADATDAKIRGYDAGTFSFNQPGGRCETCEGQGRLAIEMQFLPDVTTSCPECLGRRYRKEILAVKVRGLNIAEVLDLTVREAFRFFRTQRATEKKLKWLLDVGLEYVRLGQPLETLSQGETQRLKLAAHLAGSKKPRTLFVFIEPTRGLHPDDTAHLLECFGQLIAAGHSVVIEESNPFVLRAADHLIELGPGGCVIAMGTPDAVSKCETPTGRFLRTCRLPGAEDNKSNEATD
jgi:excinuclease ABC subunit A